MKVFVNGVCHSDYHVMEGRTFNSKVQWPVILGHEGAGIVESVGEGVTNVQPGDHVIPLYKAQCKQCKLCKSPKTNGCNKISATQAKGLMPDGTTRFTCKGKTVYHFMGTSTFSQYTVVADISICKVNSAAPMDKICLLGCGVSTGYGAALNTAKVEKGSTCAVWGLGCVGLSAVMGCKAAGAKRIIALDINPSKEAIARTFGATEFINPMDYDRPIEEVIREMTDGGCDFTFECIGNTAIMESALYSCHEGWGVATLVGVVAATQKVSVQPYFISAGGRIWKGTSFGGYKSRDETPKLVEKYMNGELMLDEFVTHTMELDKVNEAYDMLIKGKSIRTIIKLW